MQITDLTRLVRIITEAEGDTDKEENVIDGNYVHGEKFTGYENGDKGPFQCSNCKYSDKDETCGHPVMMEKSQRPREKNGRVKIDSNGCCEYVDRIGEDKQNEK